MELNSEMNFLASLFNPMMSRMTRGIVKTFPWKTDVARTLMQESNFDLSKWEPESTRAVLANKLVPAELETFIKIASNIRACNSEPQVRAMANGMFHYYKRERIADIVTSEGQNIDRMVDLISEIPKELSPATDVIQLKSLDASKVVEEELGTLDRVLPTSFDAVKNASAFGGYLPGSVVMVVGVPGLGKTAAMIQESVHASMAGYRVLYIALGDLLRFDFITRISSSVLDKPYNEVILNPAAYYTDAVKKAVENIDLVLVPSKKLTSAEIQNLVEEEPDKYDMVVIDYDSNLADNSDPDNMYHTGGEIYERATEIARPTGAKARVVMIASQPKSHLWGEELLGLDSAGESSRKQHTVDIMITIGKVRNPGNHKIGMMNIAKMRRGQSDITQAIRMTPTGRMLSITQAELAMYKGSIAKGNS